MRDFGLARLESEISDSGDSSAFRFDHAVCSDVGRKRNENQDSYGYVRTSAANLFIVADGMGGARGGATASAMAVDVVAKASVESGGSVTEHSLREAIERANDAIFERSRQDEELAGMGTTIVALAVVNDRAIIAHVGDSRIYRYRDRKLTQLTRDHTLVQELVDSGSISPEQAENHPIAHMLTRSLGPAGAVDVETKAIAQPLQVGDRFLLCSDGLYNLVPEGDIEKIFLQDSLEEAAQTLVELANERGGTDNITVELIEVRDPEGQSDSLAAGEVEFFTSSEVEYSDDSGTPYPLEEIVAKEQAIVLQEDSVVDAEASAVPSNGVAETEEEDQPEEQFDQELDPIEPEIDPHVSDSELGDLQRIQVVVMCTALVAVVAAIYAVLPTSQQIASDPKNQVVTEEQQVAAELEQWKEELNSGDVSELPTGPQIAARIFEDPPVPSPTERLEPTRVETAPIEPQPAELVVAQLRSPKKVLQLPVPARATLRIETAQVSLPEEAIRVEVEPQISTTPAVATPQEPSTEDTSPVEVARVDTPQVETGVPAGTTEPVDGETQQKASPVASVAPVAQYETSTDRKVAEAIAAATDMSVPPAPRVKVTATNARPKQPIVWEHEKLALSKLPRLEPEDRTTPQKATPSPIVLGAAEKEQLMSEKAELREQIANIDAKLLSFRLRSREEASSRAKEIEQQLVAVRAAREQAEQNLEIARERYDAWKGRQRSVDLKEVIGLAEQVSTNNIQVRRRRDAYQIASVRYLDAVELWRENPSEGSAASQMSALGRELENRRIELEQAIIKAVNNALERLSFDIAEFGTLAEDLKRREDRLSRHAGFAKGFIPQPSSSRMENQRTLLDERNVVVEKLDSLRLRLSDEDEVEFRRDQLLKAHSVN